MLPNTARSPAPPSAGYCDSSSGIPAYHATNGTKQTLSSLAEWGKLNEVGTSTSTSSASVASGPPSAARSSRERSTSSGSTMNRFDVTNAVTSASCEAETSLRWPTCVVAATSPGSSQNVSRQAKPA